MAVIRKSFLSFSNDRFGINVPAYDDKLYSEVKGNFTSSKVEGNTLTVTFAPNETQNGRYVRVNVSAGDIFDKIMFVQKPE